MNGNETESVVVADDRSSATGKGERDVAARLHAAVTSSATAVDTGTVGALVLTPLGKVDRDLASDLPVDGWLGFTAGARSRGPRRGGAPRGWDSADEPPPFEQPRRRAGLAILLGGLPGRVSDAR